MATTSEGYWSRGSVRARFWSLVDVRGENECWAWQASTQSKGYGQFRVAQGRNQQLAHHVAFWFSVGPILDKKPILRHSCDSPPCCNPAHLKPGTHLDNSRDMVRRGRSMAGERHHNAKLTETMAKAMIAERATMPFPAPRNSITEMASRYEVPVYRLKDLLYGNSWKHLPRPWEGKTRSETRPCSTP